MHFFFKTIRNGLPPSRSVDGVTKTSSLLGKPVDLAGLVGQSLYVVDRRLMCLGAWLSVTLVLLTNWCLNKTFFFFIATCVGVGPPCCTLWFSAHLTEYVICRLQVGQDPAADRCSDRRSVVVSRDESQVFTLCQ